MVEKNENGDYTYLNSVGETVALDTADAVARAVADLGNRFAALETAPREAGDAGALAGRIERIEAVAGNYLGGEFADYDRRHGNGTAA